MLVASNIEHPFPKLQVLDVSNNAFVGSLPDRYFKNFRSMINAKESQTDYGMFLGFLEMTITVKGLDQLMRRPLDTFTIIDLSSNRFSGRIPPSIGNLKSLRYLNLSDNTIGGHIPSSLGGMSILESLDLSSNKLDGQISGELVRLTFLAKLNLSMNNLEGQIPQSAQLSTLGNESYAGNAGLCGFPLTRKCERSDGKPSPQVEADREIEWDYVFAAAGYVLSLVIFSLLLLLCKSFRLKRIRISYNHLYGEIPSSLERCSNLEYFSVHSNNFSGHVPTQIGNFPLLQQLFLSANNFSGSIPLSICHLRSLDVLFFSKNNLEGTIPDCLGNLSRSLSILNLNENKLTGVIPSTFTKGCNLQTINLNGNKLKGTLPQTLANCQGLFGIDVGDNEIRGAFPFWMEKLPHLRILVLRSNKFNGTMLVDSNSNNEQPFPHLQVLDVSNNAFVGSLPDRYINKFLGMIDVEENQTDDEENLFITLIDVRLTLKGLDQSLRRLLNTLTSLDFSSNRFSGNIPLSLGNLNSLRYLNLSYNTLTGHIPSSLGRMSILESLDLSSNKLDGEIPDELSRLTFLGKLNLSMNNLEGQIPESTQLSTFGNESYEGNTGLCGFPLTKECEGGDGKPSPPFVEVESDREIKWDYVFAAAGYIMSLGIFSWLILFCPSFRYKYFEKVDDVFEKIFECYQRRKKRERRRRALRNQAKRQQRG
ncbi:receptor like protein 23-like [Salvia splendens]|uniref:receptor like protein 23-like n=1 Tax=Salvia splendens TaxID=180675 RepID=UPI001C259F76|nr:receptor like protein 23-like [Salvia splendens]